VISPVLCFDGNAREAITFYEDAFSSKADIYDGEDGKVAHAELEVQGGKLMLADNPDAVKLTTGNSIQLSVNLTDSELLTDIYQKLVKGGTVIVPLGETPWSPLYGFVQDKFNILWQINHD